MHVCVHACVCVGMHICMCMCVHECMCIDGMNMKSALRWHISSFHTMPAYTHEHTGTHILIPFEDSKPTGLKVDVPKTNGAN